METNAKGTKGFILYSPIIKNYFFRVYNEDHTFKDYRIHCEELGVEIVCDWLSFYESETGNILDWSTKALGKNHESRTTK